MDNQRIQFINHSVEPGRLKGRLFIGDDRQRQDLVGYQLHWGHSESERLAGNSLIKSFRVANAGTETSPRYAVQRPMSVDFVQAAIPEEARYFLLYVEELNGEQYLYARREIRNSQHLLPPSATRLERQLASTAGRLSQLPVQLHSLWDPYRCPAPLLPWLAWAVSIDIWPTNPEDPAEEASQRREVISRNAFVHKHKGTRAAIQQALNTFTGTSITLTEWWEETPPAAPHTFKLDLLVNRADQGAGSADLNTRLRQAIDAVKPVRSHYTFTISTVQSSALRLAAVTEAVSHKRFHMSAVLAKREES